MRRPPVLDPAVSAGPIQPRYALLINPFYPKDPDASFGKHMLTPTLALTSFAATTPEHWQVRYWDENLLDGRPPFAVMPEVVGITVHLTFARRAFELAQWYRSRGSKVVLGGLHVQSCPEECAAYADALAVGDGVQIWPDFTTWSGCLRSKYRRLKATIAGSGPRVDASAPEFSHDHQSDCHPRLYNGAATWQLMACVCRIACESPPGRRELLADRQPYAVFVDNNLGSNREYLRELCRALRR
jgi:hypothetical protein